MTKKVPLFEPLSEFLERTKNLPPEEDEDYPTSDGIYHPKATVPEDPPRDDDSYGKDVSHG